MFSIKYYYYLFILVLFSVFVSAETYRSGEDLNINYPCLVNGEYCSSNGACNISVFYPNTTNIISNASMTNNNDYFTYSLTNTSAVGDYTAIIKCGDGNQSSNTFLTYQFTKNGLENPNQFYFSFSIAVIIAILLTMIIILDTEHFAVKLVNLFFIITFALYIPLSYVIPNVTELFYRSYQNYIYLFVAYVLIYFVYWLLMKFKSFRVSA